MFRILGLENECAKHGTEHMVLLENIKSKFIIQDKEIEINSGTWVCTQCTSAEYLAELKGQNHEAGLSKASLKLLREGIEEDAKGLSKPLNWDELECK